MRISISSVFVVGLTFFSLLAMAAASFKIQAGEYLYEDGTGILSIKPQVNGAHPFTLQTTGANAQTCEMEGIIKDEKAILKNNKTQPCVLKFKTNHKGISVSSASNTCFEYCGLNATFEGLYRQKTP